MNLIKKSTLVLALTGMGAQIAAPPTWNPADGGASVSTSLTLTDADGEPVSRALISANRFYVHRTGFRKNPIAAFYYGRAPEAENAIQNPTIIEFAGQDTLDFKQAFKNSQPQAFLKDSKIPAIAALTDLAKQAGSKLNTPIFAKITFAQPTETVFVELKKTTETFYSSSKKSSAVVMRVVMYGQTNDIPMPLFNFFNTLFSASAASWGLGTVVGTTLLGVAALLGTTELTGMTNITGRRSKAPWVYNAQKFAFAIGEKLAEKMRLYKSENDPGFILLPPAHTLDPNHLYSKYPKSKDYILIENALLDKTDHKDFANTDHKTFVENALRRALNPSNAGNSAFKQKVFMMYLSDVYPSDGLEGTIKDADITKLYREGWDLCILEDEDADLSRDHSILSKNLKPDGRKCATVDLSLLSALRRATSTKEAAAAMNKCLETIARQLA